MFVCRCGVEFAVKRVPRGDKPGRASSGRQIDRLGKRGKVEATEAYLHMNYEGGGGIYIVARNATSCRD